MQNELPKFNPDIAPTIFFGPSMRCGSAVERIAEKIEREEDYGEARCTEEAWDCLAGAKGLRLEKSPDLDGYARLGAVVNMDNLLCCILLLITSGLRIYA
jgi:hypothetical protein